MAEKKPLKVEGGKVIEFAATDTVKPENLGSGTRDGSKFLRDDGTWQAVAGGSGLTHPQVMSRVSLRI